MHIQISLSDGVPIYRQIVNQIKYMAASGRLEPGAELPPIRVLAEQLQVTPNTVVKAYRELEVEGIVNKRRGAGTYLSKRGSPLAHRERRKIIEQRADALLAEARQMNFTFDAVMEILLQRESVLSKEAGKAKGHVSVSGSH